MHDQLAVSGATSSAINATDVGYDRLEALIRARLEAHRGPLFTTDVDTTVLYATYLPRENRQYYSCRACERFIYAYGGLVTIADNGDTKSLLWGGPNDVPGHFGQAMQECNALVERAKVTGVFLSSEKEWGQRATPDKKRGLVWSHLSGPNPTPFVARGLTAEQVMAEKRQDFQTLKRARDEYSKSAAEQALRVLRSDNLARSEKALAIAEWFVGIHSKDRNQLWLAVATAPPGFCHVKTTMISTLLDDIVQGLEFSAIARRWSKKMNPLQYQRPQAPPKEGAITAAEKLVERLGIARSLERRFARLDEVPVRLWEPKPQAEAAQAPPDALFGHLRGRAKSVKPVKLPATTLSWEKFARTVLPQAHTLARRAFRHTVPSTAS